MSIIVLTPKPPQNAAVANTDSSLSVRLASDFLHLLGQEGHRFDSFEQLRDYAQAQIDAAAALAKIDANAGEAVSAPLAEATPVAPAAEPVSVPVPAAEGSQDAAAAVNGTVAPAVEPMSGAPLNGA